MACGSKPSSLRVASPINASMVASPGQCPSMAHTRLAMASVSSVEALRSRPLETRITLLWQSLSVRWRPALADELVHQYGLHPSVPHIPGLMQQEECHSVPLTCARSLCAKGSGAPAAKTAPKWRTEPEAHLCDRCARHATCLTTTLKKHAAVVHARQ